SRSPRRTTRWTPSARPSAPASGWTFDRRARRRPEPLPGVNHRLVTQTPARANSRRVAPRVPPGGPTVEAPMGSGSRPNPQAQAEAPERGLVSPAVADNVTRMVHRGLQRFQAGDAKGAARIFRALVGASPNQPLAWNHLALALTSLDRHEEAAAA